MIKYTFFTLALILGLLACKPKNQKLAEAIYKLETSDTSSTPAGMNELSDLYFKYAQEFSKDSIAEKYLFKGFMFKYITEHWDDAIKFANLYKSTYPVNENTHSINLKLADLYARGKNNIDSSVHYYLLADGKIQFSTDEYRKAGAVLEKSIQGKPLSDSNASKLYTAAKCYQLSAEFSNAVKLYSEVSNTYPKFNKSPDALMAAGFICWNDLKELERAKVFYKQLVERYPENELAKEASMILSENILEMNEMQLAEYLMKKNKEKGR